MKNKSIVWGCKAKDLIAAKKRREELGEENFNETSMTIVKILEVMMAHNLMFEIKGNQVELLQM